MLWQSVNILIFEVEIGFIADLIDLLTARVVFSDFDKGITLHDMVELIASHEGGKDDFDFDATGVFEVDCFRTENEFDLI